MRPLSPEAALIAVCLIFVGTSFSFVVRPQAEVPTRAQGVSADVVVSPEPLRPVVTPPKRPIAPDAPRGKVERV
jgi:hypothetical protein